MRGKHKGMYNLQSVVNEHSGQTYGDSAKDREGKDLTCGQESVVTDDGIAETEEPAEVHPAQPLILGKFLKSPWTVIGGGNGTPL